MSRPTGRRANTGPRLRRRRSSRKARGRCEEPPHRRSAARLEHVDPASALRCEILQRVERERAGLRLLPRAVPRRPFHPCPSSSRYRSSAAATATGSSAERNQRPVIGQAVCLPAKFLARFRRKRRSDRRTRWRACVGQGTLERTGLRRDSAAVGPSRSTPRAASRLVAGEARYGSEQRHEGLLGSFSSSGNAAVAWGWVHCRADNHRGRAARPGQRPTRSIPPRELATDCHERRPWRDVRCSAAASTKSGSLNTLGSRLRPTSPPRSRSSTPSSRPTPRRTSRSSQAQRARHDLAVEVAIQPSIGRSGRVGHEERIGHRAGSKPSATKSTLRCLNVPVTSRCVRKAQEHRPREVGEPRPAVGERSREVEARRIVDHERGHAGLAVGPGTGTP